VAIVDGDRERGALSLGVRHDHQRQVQLVGPGGLQRHAEHPGGVLEVKRHALGRDVLGGHDQIAFVLAVLVVDDHDHAASAQLLDCLFDR